jgi:hypothetical protein
MIQAFNTYLKRGLICGLLLFSIGSACSQGLSQKSERMSISPSNPFHLGERMRKVEVQQGFLFPHHADMSHMYSGYQSIEYKQLKTLKGFTHTVGKPAKMGFHAGYYHFNSEHMGQGLAAGLAFAFPLNNYSTKYYSNFGFVYGLGYISKPFDVQNNPMNRAIGSPINGYAQISLEGGIKMNDYWSMGARLGMSHFSNGNAKAPNLGVNLPFVSISANKSILFWGHRVESGEGRVKRGEWFVSSRVGYKSVDVDDDRKMGVFVVEGGYSIGVKQHVWKGSVSLHTDPIYRFEKFQEMEAFSLTNGVEGAAAVGYEKIFDDWKLCVDAGVYLFTPAKGYKTAYFERLGVSRRLSQHWEAMVKLRANKAVADVVEWGLVYNW